MTKAFLLTRQLLETSTGAQLQLWFSSHVGPIKVIIKNPQIVFFVRQNDIPEINKHLINFPTIETKRLALKSFKFEPMAGVYFKTQQQFYRAREILKKHSISCFESDIRPIERYLTERFLTGPVLLHSNTNNIRNLINPKIIPTDYQPDLKVMSFDIETDYQTNHLYSIAFICADKKRVLMIGNENSTDKVEFVQNEDSLLKRFLYWVEIIDPDVFIGWNVVNFDFNVLQKAADRLRISFSIGRQHSTPIWRQQKNTQEREFLLIPGRVVLDGIDTLKSATYAFQYYSLEYISHELLGRGKLIEQNNNYDPLHKAKEIKRQFFEEKFTLAEYNLEDCQLVLDIFQCTNLISFAIERARLTGLEMDRVGGSVAAFDNLYLPLLHRKGFIAPNIEDNDSRLSAPGGYVMDSIPGMHLSVLVLDYKSLYPSIIRTFKVDPYGRIAAKNLHKKDTVPGYDGAYFSKDDHILPNIIRHLWEARDVAKTENNKALSQAIKIIMNSFYGVLGTPGCRIHDSRLTSSITKRSHDIIQQTVKIIEACGYSVIYGDTDSVFLAMNKKIDTKEANKIGSYLVNKINQYWVTELKIKYGLTSYLEMEYETHYNKFFMPTIRGSDTGSKKRYAGLIINDTGEKKIIFKGLEAVRTDWTLLAREFQQTLYALVFNEESYNDYIKNTVHDLTSGKCDHKLIYRKRLRQKLEDYKKNIPPHAQAAIKAEKYFKENNLPSRYRNKSWIEYIITVRGPETRECQFSALNYEHYIEKQLTPIADTILSTMGGSMTAIIQNQIELF